MINKNLMYVSTCLSDEKTKAVIGDLDKIRKFNLSRGITGALLHVKQNESAFFVQFIEGAPKEINALYERITRDSRHKNVKVIYSAYNGIRFFDNWSMGFIQSKPSYSEESFLTEEMIKEILVSIERGTPRDVISLIQIMYEMPVF